MKCAKCEAKLERWELPQDRRDPALCTKCLRETQQRPGQT